MVAHRTCGAGRTTLGHPALGAVASFGECGGVEYSHSFGFFRHGRSGSRDTESPKLGLSLESNNGERSDQLLGVGAARLDAGSAPRSLELPSQRSRRRFGV